MEKNYFDHRKVIYIYNAPLELRLYLCTNRIYVGSIYLFYLIIES